MNIKDFLHYYLGQKHRYRYVDWEIDHWSPWLTLTGGDLQSMEDASIEKIELALRRLEDMTSEEKIIYHGKMRKGTDGVHVVIIACDTPASFHYLLQQGFDMFSLIDNGLAVDAKTLEK